MNEMLMSLFSDGVWALIKAVLFLLLAFIAAAIVKSLVVKLLTKTKLSVLLGKTDASPDGGKRMLEHIGKLVYLLVFLLFVPGIFESLGMHEISMPILNFLDTMWGCLPNILAAVLVLWVGSFIARLVRELLVPVFARLKVNALQKKAGIQVADTARLSDTLAYIVYVLILIPVIIAALQVLNIQAVSDPAIRMLDTIFEFIPNILASLIIIIIGCMVARFSGNIVESLIASAGFDAKLSERLEDKGKDFVLSKVAGRIVNIIMVIFFIVESFGVLHLDVLTGIGNAVIGYMPYVLASTLILLVCYVCDGLAGKALLRNNHTVMALVSKIAIYTIGIFMVLNELGIAKEIVNTSFILIVAALAIAFAISFGIGGREFAGKVLKKLEDACGMEHESKE
ncbi:MAG: mechanosensitive ion channel [Lachnospiraceae bacterium]|nr:mechanosensitive ion channel [Lachnospiraceae bacterium]